MLEYDDVAAAAADDDAFEYDDDVTFYDGNDNNFNTF